MRLRHEDYVLSVFNISDNQIVPIPRVTSVSIDTDYKTNLTLQIADNGVTSVIMEDTPVTVFTFKVNIVTSPAETYLNPLSWLASIAGEISKGRFRETFFAIGETVTHYPDAESPTNVSDFDRGITKGSTRVDGWVAVRDPRHKQLARVHALINAQVTSLDFNFSIDEVASADISMESDGLATYIKNIKGCDIDTKYLDNTDVTNMSVTTENFSRIIAVWLNWRPLRGWTTLGNNTLDFSNISGLRLYNGDIVKYVYIPDNGERDWDSYKRISAKHSDAGTRKSQMQLRLLTDTTVNRVVYGFFPILKDENIVVIQSDGINNVIALKAGTVWINNAYYYTGFTNGEVESISESVDTTTITDTHFTETTTDFWKGATITMVSGNAAGETLKVTSYSTGGVFTLKGTFSVTPSVWDEFYLNASKVMVGSASHDAIFVYIDSGKAVIGTGESTSPPNNSVKLADITVSGSDITTYTDNRTFSGNIVEGVKSINYSIPLDRTIVNELGYEEVVDRSLDKPVGITTSIVVYDRDTDLIKSMTNYSSDTITPSKDYLSTLGAQLILYRNRPATASKPYLESDIAVIIETTDNRPITDSLATSIDSKGETTYGLLSDNIRIFVVN